MFRALRNRSGQGMTEYIIIICLVAVAALLVIGVFGTNIRTLFQKANQSLTTGQAEKADMDDQGGGEARISDFTDKK
jgi:pilus assembly protein Flp/PilA